MREHTINKSGGLQVKAVFRMSVSLIKKLKRSRNLRNLIVNITPQRERIKIQNEIKLDDP